MITTGLDVLINHSNKHTLVGDLLARPFLTPCLMARSSEVVLDGRHLEVGLILDDAATNVDLEVATAGWLIVSRDLLVDGLGSLLQARCVLIAREVGVVEGHFAAGDHRNFHTVVLAEPVEDLLEGHGALLQHDLIVVGEAFWEHRDRAAHDRVELLRLVLDDIIRLAHHDGWKGEVNESVLELLNIGEALCVLVNFIADNTSNHGSCRGNGGNNLAGNHFCLIAVALSDFVVAGTEV